MVRYLFSSQFIAIMYTTDYVNNIESVCIYQVYLLILPSSFICSITLCTCIHVRLLSVYCKPLWAYLGFQLISHSLLIFQC